VFKADSADLRPPRKAWKVEPRVSKERGARANAATWPKRHKWVNTRGTSYPFSFDSVCDALEIDAVLVRSRLRELTIRSATSARRLALVRLRL
jgi:hypothetical protein